MRHLALSAVVLDTLPLIAALGTLVAPGCFAPGFLGRAAILLGAAFAVGLSPAVVLALALPKLMGSADEEAHADDPFHAVLAELGSHARAVSAAVSERS